MSDHPGSLIRFTAAAPGLGLKPPVELGRRVPLELPRRDAQIIG